MTHAQVVGVIRKKAGLCGGLSALARQHGGHISTLSNMLHGRNRFTPRVLRLLGLEYVRIVERVDGQTEEPVVWSRPYRRMWRLGDWPRFTR